MVAYLLDTNILLRAADPASASHTLAAETVVELLSRGDECYITPQVLIELWVVATRPTDVNGLGWGTERTGAEIDELLHQFKLLEETPAVFKLWRALVTQHHIKGKRVHDARLVAVMQSYAVTHLLTLNPNDFQFDAGIIVVHPDEVTTITLPSKPSGKE